MKKIILLALVTFTGIIAAHAQTTTSSVEQTVTLTLRDAISISLASSTGTSFSFDDVSKYQNGITNLNATTISIKSNRPWTATVKTATANFSGPASSPAMPASVLGLRMTGSGSGFGYLSSAGLNYGTGDRGSYSFSVDYNANPGFSYDAGLYTISVVYTATQL